MKARYNKLSKLNSNILAIILLSFPKAQTDFTIRQGLVDRILKEKGQTLVIRLLHASVFSLPSYMLSDVADVFVELSLTDRQVRYKNFPSSRQLSMFFDN